MLSLPTTTTIPVSVPLLASGCSRNEYRCKEGRCISKRFLCDGWQDCQDGADEKNCVSTCGSNEFRCPGGNTCLHESVKCNGDFDCPDGGDELQVPDLVGLLLGVDCQTTAMFYLLFSLKNIIFLKRLFTNTTQTPFLALFTLNSVSAF